MPLKRLVIIFLLIAISAPVWSHLSAAPAELLVNGGFESGVSGWQTYFGQLSQVANRVYTGSFAAAYTSTDFKSKWFYQDIPVGAGSVYSFSGWALKDNPNISEVKLRISWYSQSTGYGNSQAAGAEISSVTSTVITSDSAVYRFLNTGQVAAPSRAIIARLKVMVMPVSESSATVYFDGLSFTRQESTSPIIPVPPGPGTDSGGGGGQDSGDSSDPPTVVPPSPTVGPSPVPVPPPSVTPAVTPTFSPTPTVLPVQTPTLGPTQTPTPSPSPTPTVKLTPTPTPSRTPTVRPTQSATPTRTPTVRPIPTPSPTGAFIGTPGPLAPSPIPTGGPMPARTPSLPTPILTPVIPVPVSTPSDMSLPDSPTLDSGGSPSGSNGIPQNKDTPTVSMIIFTPLPAMPVTGALPVTNPVPTLSTPSVVPSLTPRYNKDPDATLGINEVTLTDEYPVYTPTSPPPLPDSDSPVGGLTVALASLGAASVALSLWLRKWI